MEFDRKRQSRWAAGREERGLAKDAPFQGNPLLEAEEELLDAANYFEEALHQGLMPEDVAFEAMRKVRDLYTMTETMKG
jgi:hypothetical protein